MNWCPLYCRSIYYFLVLYNWGLCKWLELKPEHSKSLKVRQCCSTCYLHNPDCCIDEALGHLIQLKRQGLFYSQFSVKVRFFDLAGFCFLIKAEKSVCKSIDITDTHPLQACILLFLRTALYSYCINLHFLSDSSCSSKLS
jgi:hypothetical protein